MVCPIFRMFSGSRLIRICKHRGWQGLKMDGASPFILELGPPPRFTPQARCLGLFPSLGPECLSPSWLQLAEPHNSGTLKTRWFVRAELTLSQGGMRGFTHPPLSCPTPPAPPWVRPLTVGSHRRVTLLGPLPAPTLTGA